MFDKTLIEPLLWGVIGVCSFTIALRVVGWYYDRKARSEVCPYCGFRTYPDAIKIHIQVHEMKMKGSPV